MKKQLLFNLTKFLSQKTTLKMAAFAVLMLMTMQSSFAQSWDILGNEVQIASAATTGTSIVVLNESGNEIPYVAFLEGSIPRVKKRGTNGIWTQVGSDIDIALSSTYPYLNIFADANGKLFVSYILGDKKVYVKTYNTATSNWEPLNNDVNNKIVSSANGVYVASTNFKSPRSYMAFDSSNNIYIAYTADGICNVKKYNNTTNVWESFGNTIGSTVTPLYIASQKIIFDEAGTMWVGVVTATASNATSGNVKLFKYNAGTNAFDDTASGTNPTTSIRELDIALVKGTGLSTSGRIAMALNDTGSGTRGNVYLYDKTANSWGTVANVGSSKASTYIHIISDDFGNLYYHATDQITSAVYNASVVKKLNAGTTTPWYELKDPATIRGVDEPTNNNNIGIASGSTTPYIIYTKANLAANISTPIVRKFAALVGTPPVITSFTPLFSATPPAPSVAFTITGTNFTGATDVFFGGKAVTSFTVVSATSITGTIAADALVNSTVSVTTSNGTYTAIAPSALTYTSAPSTYNGTLLRTTVTAPSTVAYSITPALPAGMSINLGTGTISGSPTAVTASTSYTITATNTYGSTTTTINFATAGPSGLTYPVALTGIYTGGPYSASITASSPAAPLVYSVNKALPAGLTIDVNTGTISGSPTAVTVSTTYTITATNTYGNTSVNAIFSTSPPSALSYGTVPSSYTTGTAITSLVATITPGAGTPAYTVSPGLPAGLTLDTNTGGISGTPTAVTTSTAYTVTATTIYGSTTKVITFATGSIAPSAFSYTPAVSASYIQGTAITSLTAVITAGDGTPVYTVTPALPAGLVLDAATGGISGTPTAVTASASYTVTATTFYGTTTNVITFSVDSNLSTDSFEKSDAVKAYPNPTADTVTVSLPNSAVVQKIAVYNSLGQLVRTETKNSVSLQNLANGNYYLTIYTSEGNYSKKIIKK